MSARRFGAVLVCLFGIGLASGVAQAGAAGPARVLALRLSHVQVVWTGPSWNRDTNPPTPPPIGEQAQITGLVYNEAAQFGKAGNAQVGRIVLSCTVVAIPTDGLCAGMIHVPDGFFTIAGNGPFVGANVRRYAITGGIGPYANARGELKTSGAGDASVILYSP